MSNGFRKGSKKPSPNLPSYSHALSGPALFSRDLAAFASINSGGKISSSKQIPTTTQNSNIESPVTVDENTFQNESIKVPEDQTSNNSNNNQNTPSSTTNSGSDIIALRTFLKSSGSSLKVPSSPNSFSSVSCPTSPLSQKDLAKIMNASNSATKSKSKRLVEQVPNKNKKMKTEVQCDSTQSSTPALQILSQANPEVPISPKLSTSMENNNNEDSQYTQNTQMYFNSSSSSPHLQQKERQFTELTQENTELKSSLENLQSKLQDISHLLREIDPNSSIQTSLQASIHKQLQSQMQEVKKSLEQSSKQKIRALEKKLSLRDEQHQLDQVKLLSIETELESLRAKAHVSEGILNQLEQTESERKQQIEKRLQLTIENEQLKMSLQIATQQVQSLESEKLKMQSQMSSLEQKLEESQNSHAEVLSIVQKLQITLDDAVQKVDEERHLLEQANLENVQLWSLLQNEQEKVYMLENANQHLLQQLNKIDAETGWNGPTQYEEAKHSGKPSNQVSQENVKAQEDQLQQLVLLFQQLEQHKKPAQVSTVTKQNIVNIQVEEEVISNTQLEQQLDLLTMKEQERIKRLELHLVKTFLELSRARSGSLKSTTTIQKTSLNTDNPLSSSQES